MTFRKWLWLAVLGAAACAHEAPQPASVRPAPARSAPVRTSAATAGMSCSTDADCEAGYRCTTGLSGTASMCKKTDEESTFRSLIELPVASCTVSTDCPVGFHCDRDAAVCVK